MPYISIGYDDFLAVCPSGRPWVHKMGPQSQPKAVLPRGTVVFSTSSSPTALTPPSSPSPSSLPRRKKACLSSIPYLFFHHNTPTFRIRIPAELQACLGKTEYRRNVGRCYAPEAKLRALRLATAALEAFSFAREALQVRDQAKHSLTHYHETGKKSTGKNDNGYTPSRDYREISQVTQDVSTNDSGYTNDTSDDQGRVTNDLPLQGRTLASLTDDEIRSIAETMLLAALKTSALLSIDAAFNKFIHSDEVFKEVPNAGGFEIDAIITKLEELSEDKTGKDTAARVKVRIGHHTEMKALCEESLQSGRVDEEAAYACDKALKEQGVITSPETDNLAALITHPPTASIPYLKTYHEILKASATYHSVCIQTANGDCSAHDAEVERLEVRQEARKEKRQRRIKAATSTTDKPTSLVEEDITSTATTTPQKSQNGLKLADALPQFFDEMAREGNWDARTQVKEPSKFILFRDIVDPDGSLLVSNINADTMRDYKKVMLGLCKGRNHPPYNTMPPKELFQKARNGEIPQGERMAPRTLDNYFTQIANFINWLGRNGYHTNTTITGLLRIKLTKQAHENREPYTKAELTRIFDPKDFLTEGLQQERRSEYPSRFWIPLLGLFTGARLEELAQLDLEDIVAVEREEGTARPVFNLKKQEPVEVRQRETLCIAIREGKGQSLKNKSSRRYVPLSSILVGDLNFLGGYLAKVYANRHNKRNTRIFPELIKVSAKNSYSNAVGKWFQRYRKNIGITKSDDGGKKDFHSFRDTIAYWCDQIGNVAEKPAARYLGHAYGTMTFGVYSKDTAPHILYDLITCPFTEYARQSFLDVEGLKQSEWVS